MCEKKRLDSMEWRQLGDVKWRDILMLRRSCSKCYSMAPPGNCSEIC